jgi:hypothetical protein
MANILDWVQRARTSILHVTLCLRFLHVHFFFFSILLSHVVVDLQPHLPALPKDATALPAAAVASSGELPGCRGCERCACGCRQCSSGKRQLAMEGASRTGTGRSVLRAAQHSRECVLILIQSCAHAWSAPVTAFGIRWNSLSVCTSLSLLIVVQCACTPSCWQKCDLG